MRAFCPVFSPTPEARVETSPGDCHATAGSTAVTLPFFQGNGSPSSGDGPQRRLSAPRGTVTHLCHSCYSSRWRSPWRSACGTRTAGAFLCAGAAARRRALSRSIELERAPCHGLPLRMAGRGRMRPLAMCTLSTRRAFHRVGCPHRATPPSSRAHHQSSSALPSLPPKRCRCEDRSPRRSPRDRLLACTHGAQPRAHTRPR